MAYDIDFVEEAKLRFHVRSFFLYPQYWSENGAAITFNTQWKRVQFTKRNQKNIPRARGVYAFVLEPKYSHLVPTRYLFYVGKTNRTLQKRYGEYLDEKDGKGKTRRKVFKMLKLYAGCLHFCYTELANADQVNALETNLLDTFVPHVNTLIPRARIKPELKGIYEAN